MESGEKLPELSVFFPAYNEEERISATVKKALAVAPKAAEKYEIVVINDGSKDKTGEVIDSLAEKHNYVRALHHKKNRGYGAALKTGFYKTKYQWITFTDSDGQFDFSEITDFIEAQKKTGKKLVIGYYKKRQVPFYRKVNTFLWEGVVRILFGLNVRDIDTAFKLIHRDVINTIPKLESERGAFISSEFLIKAKKAGFGMVEVPVTHFPREEGKGTGSNLDVIVKSFVDLFKLWKKLR